MHTNKLPQKDYLDQVLIEVNGALFGRVRPIFHFPTTRAMNIWNAKFAGKQLGRIMPNGMYRQVMVDGVRYLEHRIVAVLHGLDVEGMVIDHKDGNGLNNRIENLRACSQSENMRNNAGWSKKLIRVGVHRLKSGRWTANIRENGKQKNLGRFENEATAIAARIEAERQIYGEFAVDNREHGVVWGDQRRAA